MMEVQETLKAPSPSPNEIQINDLRKKRREAIQALTKRAAQYRGGEKPTYSIKNLEEEIILTMTKLAIQLHGLGRQRAYVQVLKERNLLLSEMDDRKPQSP